MKYLIKTITYLIKIFEYIAVNFQKEGFIMKTACYKKTDNGIEKIENDFDKLNDNNPEAVLLKVYQDLFNKIDKGSNVVSFVRTSEYKDGLLDALQRTIEDTLRNKSYLKSDNIKGDFLHAFYCDSKNMLNEIINFDLLKNAYSDLIIESRDYGVTDTYINEVVNLISKDLTDIGKRIFFSYYVKGLTIKEIAEDMGTDFSNIQRSLQGLAKHIHKFKVSYFYENRYVAYNSGKKKRQHIRLIDSNKKLEAENKTLHGIPYHISVSDYEPQETYNGFTVPTNKLPWNDKQCSKHQTVIDKDTYQVIACNRFAYDKSKRYADNVYSQSDMLYNGRAKEKKEHYERYIKGMLSFLMK
jgi:hypothetical protein